MEPVCVCNGCDRVIPDRDAVKIPASCTWLCPDCDVVLSVKNLCTDCDVIFDYLGREVTMLTWRVSYIGKIKWALDKLWAYVVSCK